MKGARYLAVTVGLFVAACSGTAAPREAPEAMAFNRTQFAEVSWYSAILGAEWDAGTLVINTSLSAADRETGRNACTALIHMNPQPGSARVEAADGTVLARTTGSAPFCK
jgi:hypothetical protein